LQYDFNVIYGSANNKHYLAHGKKTTGKSMTRKQTTVALALLALAVSSSVAAKTLVYCSEGSPENFNPQLYTSGTSVDASAVPVYNRLVDFKAGTTELQPSLAESWEVSEDGKVYTFHLRKGVKFQSNKFLRRRAILMPTTSFSLYAAKRPAASLP
jgi:ABC-type transport system substrate-binding protein